MAYAKRVIPLDNYNIIVKFNTGETKIYNCYPLLNSPLFAKLKDKAFFMTAHIDETGLVCWDNATDIPPDELYNNSVDIIAARCNIPVITSYEEERRKGYEEGRAEERPETARSIIRVCTSFNATDDETVDILMNELRLDHDTARAFFEDYKGGR